MEITLDKLSENIKKPEIERVQKEKKEYKLLGTFLRRKGLKLFAYNHTNDNLEEIKIEYSETLHLIPDEYGGLQPTDLELQKVLVDSRDTFFEALRYESAKARLNKWKEGRIKELRNLKEPNKEGLKFW